MDSGLVRYLAVLRKTAHFHAMVIAVSKVTAKSQTVLPKPVCEKLGVSPGDFVRFTIEDDQVTLARHVNVDDDPFHAFTEWASAEDELTYGKL
jgi:AbrB family looped-hinge helix DNA binding protein